MSARAARFVTVGLAGFLVQLGLLWGLIAAGCPYMPATAIAVELTVLHNFCWHLRWTWADRRTPRVAQPLIRFHAGTGVLSLGGNLFLTAIFVEAAGLPPIAANVISVAILAAVNYAAADRWVFVPPPCTTGGMATATAAS